MGISPAQDLEDNEKVTLGTAPGIVVRDELHGESQ
jgi:hypothetical protein